MSEALRGRSYLELPDPDGETYDDGSRDLLIEAGHPSQYPTRATHVELGVDGVYVDSDVRQLRWLIENGPTMLGWLEAAGHGDQSSEQSANAPASAATNQTPARESDA